VFLRIHACRSTSILLSLFVLPCPTDRWWDPPRRKLPWSSPLEELLRPLWILVFILPYPRSICLRIPHQEQYLLILLPRRPLHQPLASPSTLVCSVFAGMELSTSPVFLPLQSRRFALSLKPEILEFLELHCLIDLMFLMLMLCQLKASLEVFGSCGIIMSLFLSTGQVGI
jgi:hypothetical protein